MPRWSNPPLRVYHGTDTTALGGKSATIGATPTFPVAIAYCRPFTDFGQGFYVTTNLHQARQWANAKVVRTPGRSQALVLAFNVDRDEMATLEVLCFVRPIQDFWNLVHDCRNRFLPHQRAHPHQREYDLVYGPVTLWPSTLTIQDCDQISFHTERSLVVLGTQPMVIDVAPVDTFPP